MFGGSAVWGVGAPDHETIPSHLAVLLNGTLSFDVQGQETSEDAATFPRRKSSSSCGSFKRGADRTSWFSITASTMPRLSPSGRSSPALTCRSTPSVTGSSRPTRTEDIGWFARSTGLYKASRIVLDRVEGDPFERDGIIVYADRDTDSRPNYRWLAERGIDLWLFNARVIDGLARAYGFTPFMAFQPGLWSTGKPLDPSEESLIVSEMEYAGLSTLMTVRAEMAALLDDRLSNAQAPNSVVNMNDLFVDTPEPVYIDYVHVTGPGNEIASRRIVAELLERLCNQPGEHLPDRTLRQLDAGCQRWEDAE